MTESRSPGGKWAEDGAPPSAGGWRQEGEDLSRGLVGGAIVGTPLLYTMDLWHRGMLLSPGHLLGLLGAALLLNWLFSFVSGLREESSALGALADAVTAVGLGIAFSAVVLWLIGELSPAAGAMVAVGKVLIEASGVSLGASFANAYRGRERASSDRPDEASGPPAQSGREEAERKQRRADLNDLGATLAGATLFALSIAPTQEVTIIATRLSAGRQLLLLAVTLLLCYVILFASGFQKDRLPSDSPLQHPLAESVMAWALSLAAAFLLLVLLGRPELYGHPASAVSAVITLGLPATVGGAAGRLIA